MRLAALNYYGGKARMLGSWIASKLPPATRHQSYVETHAGMLGVLLQRPRAGREVINDLNDRVINWWRMVRDRGDELEQRMADTPHSRTETEWAMTALDDPDDMRRALAFTVAVTSSFMHTDKGSASFAIRRRADDHGQGPWCFADRVPALKRRLRGVCIENRRGVDVMRFFAPEPTAVLYIDPPYGEADTSSYAVYEADRSETLEVLRDARCQVAISGYGTEWDILGWERHEFITTTEVAPYMGSAERVEVLWCNYSPPTQRELM